MPPYSPQKSHPTRFRIILDRILRIIIYTLLCYVVCVILFAVFDPKFSHGPADRTVFARMDLSELKTALDAFATDVGRYPTTKEGLDALVTNPDLPDWRGPYLKRLPNDPWGSPYQYRVTYTLSSYGPDKFPHTDDDIADGPSSP